MTGLIIDGFIVGLLLVLAAGALFARSLLASVALFINFGLLVALAWVRLDAVDLALAEAAIGAGLMGVLLLMAVVQQQPESVRHPISWRAWLAGGSVIATLAALIATTLAQSDLLATQTTLALPAELAHQNLAASQVEHPVTAVLVNFRAWDTLLELAVLLLALLGIRHLTPLPHPVAVQPWSLLLAWTRILAPLLVVAAGYLLWRGAIAPGGAFQAGALLAAGAVMLRLNQSLPFLRWHHWPVRLLALAALALFTGIAVTTLTAGGGWLTYPEGLGKTLILLVEIAAAVSIALALTLIVAGEDKDFQA